MPIKINTIEKNHISLPNTVLISWETGGTVQIARNGQRISFSIDELGDLIDALTRVIIHESPKPKSECKCGECK